MSHFVIQSEVKPKPIMTTCLYTFPCSVLATSIYFKFWFNCSLDCVVTWLCSLCLARVITFTWLWVFNSQLKATPLYSKSAFIQSFFYTYSPHTLKGRLIQSSCTHVFSFASSHLYMATESRNDMERNNHFRSSLHRIICVKIKMGAGYCDYKCYSFHW